MDVLVPLEDLLAADATEMCGGELVIHADGTVECLADARCPADPALHVGRVECSTAFESGCCRETG